jgi:hypothetical protein
MSRQKFPCCHDFAGASIILLPLLRCIKSLMVSLFFWHHIPYSDSFSRGRWEALGKLAPFPLIDI